MKYIRFLNLLILFFAVKGYSQNPINSEGTSFANPSPRQWADGNLYLYGTRDEKVGTWSCYENDVLSSGDLKKWKLYKKVLTSRGPDDEIRGTDALLYAPDCLYKDSLYYFFFCTPDTNYTEGIATSNSPVGPFKAGYKLEHCNQIDPSAFLDDDGQVYYYWGQKSVKGAKMLPDMKGIDISTMRDSLITSREHFFHEGVQMFKRNNIYYLTYADESRRNRPTCIGYSTSTSPMGPFIYRGVIIDNYGCDPESWNNHGGVTEFNGKWYIFYHRSTNGSRVFRKTCVEPIEFDENGLIREVEMTSQGAGMPLDPFVATPARFACYLTGSVRITTFPDKKEFLTNICDNNIASWKYFDFKKNPRKLILKVVPRCKGVVSLYFDKMLSKKIGEVAIEAGDGKQTKKIIMNLKENKISGINPVYLHFRGNKNAKELFQLKEFCFE